MTEVPSAATGKAHLDHGRHDNATDPWVLSYNNFNPVDEGGSEALCTLGNGYWATRGSAPGSVADGIHYPGSYLPGSTTMASTIRPGDPTGLSTWSTPLTGHS